MKKILYLLRKPVDRIDPALFAASESQGDVVLLDSGLTPFPYAGGTLFKLGTESGDHALSYDALIAKIFESDQTIVI
jgi:hypothetical protein